MRAREFVRESLEKFTQDELRAMPGMEKFNSLSNSNPYMMWRFMVAAAGEPEFKMDKESPTNQKFVTVAYTKADKEIIDATAKTLGVTGTPVGTAKSEEDTDTDTISPIRAFKGYPR